MRASELSASPNSTVIAKMPAGERPSPSRFRGLAPAAGWDGPCPTLALPVRPRLTAASASPTGCQPPSTPAGEALKRPAQLSQCADDDQQLAGCRHGVVGMVAQKT